MKTEKRFHPETLNTAKWEAIIRSLRDQGYVIVPDGDVSRIVRGKGEKTGEQVSRESVTGKAVFARKIALEDRR